MKLAVDCFLTETNKAVLVRLKNGGERWVPLSVVKSTVKKPMPEPRIGMGVFGTIDIEDWWCRKNELEDD